MLGEMKLKIVLILQIMIKRSVGIFFFFFLPQMLKRRTSALLPITATCMKRGGIRMINFQINDND